MSPRRIRMLEVVHNQHYSCMNEQMSMAVRGNSATRSRGRDETAARGGQLRLLGANNAQARLDEPICQLFWRRRVRHQDLGGLDGGDLRERALAQLCRVSDDDDRTCPSD